MRELENYQVIPRFRRGRVLAPAQFGCLEGIPTLNITHGCIFECTYCYARGYSQAPRKGEVDLYVNLPSLLKEELLKKKVIPQWVILNTSSDCFQHHPDILNITYEVIRILVDRGIGISFLTKGLNPHRFIKKGPFQNLAGFKDFRCHSFSPFNCSAVLSPSHNLQMFFHPIAVQSQGNCSPGRCGRTDY